MNKQIRILMSVLSLAMSPVILQAETFDPDLYQVVEVKVLKAKPEDYRNKRIYLETTYFGYKKVFPNFVIDSGFKSDKYYWFMVNPELIPVLTKKTEEYDTLLPTLKSDTTVKVYGKLKKLRHSPRKMQQDYYYLDLEKLEVVATPAEQKKTARQKDRLEEKANANDLKKGNRKKRKDGIGGTVPPP